ncbi:MULTISPECIES: hypothetical protein [Micromonospora]|uniref:hypothetical protein n=1 Tax=Micromonospora TaxID=1873 RepID=UPI0013BB7F18|nr:hypothetical protein [Micromonospora tulbaghiae]NED51312.1 hypothetical protein [Micromonospora aurantiaca]
MTKWLLPLTMGMALVGILVFLSSHQLGAASQYAAIGSFVVAFAGLGLSLWSLRRKARGGETGEASRPDPVAGSAVPLAAPAASTTWNVTGIDSNMVNNPQKEVYIGSEYGPKPRKKRKR